MSIWCRLKYRLSKSYYAYRTNFVKNEKILSPIGHQLSGVGQFSKDTQPVNDW